LAWHNAHFGIGLHAAAPEERAAVFDRYRVGFHHLALRVKNREDVDRFHRFLLEERITVLDPPAEYPQYGPDYYAVFFADPDGMKLEVVYFPWGYWRRVLVDGRDERPRWAKCLGRAARATGSGSRAAGHRCHDGAAVPRMSQRGLEPVDGRSFRAQGQGRRSYRWESAARPERVGSTTARRPCARSRVV